MTLDDIKNGRTSIHSLKTREMLMVLAEALIELQEEVNYLQNKLQDVSFQED